MPLTPFHLGPAVLLGALLPRRLDLPTLLVASIVVDVRAALVLFGPLDGPVHGILTTFLGGTVVALVLAGAVLALPEVAPALRENIQAWLGLLRPGDTGDATSVVLAALLGVYSHVALDSFLYADARPLFPLAWNPFLGGPLTGLAVYGGCLAAGLLGLGVLAARFLRRDGAD